MLWEVEGAIENAIDVWYGVTSVLSVKPFVTLDLGIRYAGWLLRVLID